MFHAPSFEQYEDQKCKTSEDLNFVGDSDNK
jgi:hypothetical protein